MDNSSQLLSSLERGLDELSLRLSPSQLALLIDYVLLLERWNRSFNLTAVRDPLQMISRHVLDSLSIRAFIAGRSLLDIGSGAGLPGLILAIAMPELQVTVLDSALKRTRFMSQAVLELSLPNVTVVQARLESFVPQDKFDTVTSRATIALPELIKPAMALVNSAGRLVAMAGKAPQMPPQPDLEHYSLRVERLRVPGVEGERHVVVVQTRD